MQRLLASIVLLVTGLLPVAGTLSGMTAHAAELPACCRTHGKHHCAMASVADQPSVHSVCGQYVMRVPPAVAAAVKLSILGPERGNVLNANAQSAPADPLASKARFSYGFERAHLTRGPPVFLS